MKLKFDSSLIPAESRVLCALSGGADSVCLLLCLNELKSEKNIELFCVHCNHHLRGAESDSDEEFCRSLCERLSVDFYAEQLNVSEYCEKEHLSVEEGARNLRYKVFEKYSADIIATAHTLSDRCETLIFNLTRGTGLAGMSGIPRKRGRIVRPLLDVRRCEIESFLAEKGQDFVTDSTNLEDDCSRNKIRLNVIPELKKINQNVELSINNTLGIIESENDFIACETEKAYKAAKVNGGLSVGVLCGLHNALRRRVIKKFLEEKEIHADFERIDETDELILGKCGKICIGKDIYLAVENGIFGILIKTDPQAYFETPLSVGKFVICDKIVTVSTENAESFVHFKNINKKYTIFFLDYGKIQGSAVIRQKKTGDKFAPKGRGCSYLLKKFLINEKVPAEKRSELIVVADEAGICFVEGFGADERVAVGETTEKFLKIEIASAKE